MKGSLSVFERKIQTLLYVYGDAAPERSQPQEVFPRDLGISFI